MLYDFLVRLRAIKRMSIGFEAILENKIIMVLQIDTASWLKPMKYCTSLGIMVSLLLHISLYIERLSKP